MCRRVSINTTKDNQRKIKTANNSHFTTQIKEPAKY
jgi:hypothetical protein